MSRISVIIPNYNRADLIGQTIINLLAQSRQPDEIIVVDDGSTDHSVDVIRSFGSRIRLIVQANQGPGAARNAGLDAASGDYVQFQDSDDLLSRNKLEAQANQLDETAGDIAFGPFVHVRIEGNQAILDPYVMQQGMPSGEICLQKWMLRGWTTIFQSLLLRRSFLGALRYATDINFGEDMEFFFRLLSKSPRVTFVADALTLYRIDSPAKLSHDSGLSQNRRNVDWGKCLQGMILECRRQKLKLDCSTRWIFRAGIKKHLRYLQAAPETPVELARFLTDEIRWNPDFALSASGLLLRMLERIRLLRYGYRWMPGYQVSPATPQQIKLINDLGFEVGLHGIENW
jgi:glycosyltransferase involved in cell wall biosynthesis